MYLKKYRWPILVIITLLCIFLIVFLGNSYVNINKKYENTKINEVLISKEKNNEINSTFKIDQMKHKITEDSEGYLNDKIKVTITSNKAAEFPIDKFFFMNDKGDITQAEMFDDNMEVDSKLKPGENIKSMTITMKDISKANPPKGILLITDKKGIYTKYNFQ
ncbi:hypothetical protein ACWOFR_01230 [Carnobacterium gallinarum]|uniref:hypothetical protein n=1 Tax=Carnobacterium gallinarum TaxID=2749 RepID=UPI000552D474|nr:hypothetical protein [Carnobacterium gallinarum]